jgi:flagellar hook-associated protein 2
MFTIANSTQTVPNTPKQLSDIRTRLTASMLAQNPSIKLIEAQVKRDDARLSTYGKLALALDGFRSVASGLTATTSGSKSATPAATNDPATVATNVKSFVAAFNTLGKSLDGLKNGDAKSDTTALKMKAQLGAILDSAGTTQLAAIGITRKNGALTFDENKLKTTLSAQPELVTQVFSAAGGLAERMAGQVDRQIGTGGILADEAAGVTRERDKLLAQKAKVIESVNRQATLMAQQYQSGGSLMFGNTSTSRTKSPYDYSA